MSSTLVLKRGRLMRTFFYRDRIIGLLVICTAGIIFFLSSSIPESKVVGDFGSKLFPSIASWILLLCGLILIFRKAPADNKPFLLPFQWKRLGGLFGVYIAYAVALHVFGFIYATPVFLLILIMLLSRAAQQKFKTLFALGYSLLLTGAVYYLFQIVLRVRLPRGIIYKLF